MFGKILKNFDNHYKSFCLEKIKSIILKLACFETIKTGKKLFIYDSFDNHKKIKKYLTYDYSLYEKAINQLTNEGKILIDNSTNPFSFSLTDSVFDDLSHNKHPFKTWLKLNIFNIFNLILGLWGAITGTLALFLE